MRFYIYIYKYIFTMKLFFYILIFLGCITTASAQRISKILLTGTGIFQTLTITTDDNAVINLSPNGEIVSYGTEYFSERIQNYSRLEKFNGRVDLFTATDDFRHVGLAMIQVKPSPPDHFSDCGRVFRIPLNLLKVRALGSTHPR